MGLALLGCSKTQTATIDDKARLVAEELNATQACASLKDKLIHEVHDEQSLHDTYRQAQQLRCLHGDI